MSALQSANRCRPATSASFYLVRCGNCGLRVEHRLPAIRKKHLPDQNVLSHILSGGSTLAEVYQRLKWLTYLQGYLPLLRHPPEESLLAIIRDQLKSLTEN